MPNISKNLIRDVKFGKDCTVIEPVNLFECDIGNKVLRIVNLKKVKLAITGIESVHIFVKK